MTSGLQWDYNCSADVLSAWIGTPEPCDEVAVDDSVVIRISRKTHQPVASTYVSRHGGSGGPARSTARSRAPCSNSTDPPR